MSFSRLKPALPALIVALAILARLIPGPRTIDDAFITFRYARNLIAGQGFVYNPGEAVLGTTTPLYTLLMAGLGALSGGVQAPPELPVPPSGWYRAPEGPWPPWGVFPLLALLVNSLADAATCLMLWALARRLGYERAGLAAALAWAVAPFSVTFAIGGLETSLYVALLTGAVNAAVFANAGVQGFSLRVRAMKTPEIKAGGLGDSLSVRSVNPPEINTSPPPALPGTSTLGRCRAPEGESGEGPGVREISPPPPRRTGLRILAALLASLALLTRPDALILLGPLALERLYSAWQKREPIHWAELAAAIIPYGAWALFATLAFGSPLPHSILAKAAAYHLDAGEALIRLIQHYATPFLEQDLLGTPLAVGIGLFLYPFLSFWGARSLFKIRPRPPLALWAWALYPWLYFITFALPNPLIFRWYLTPPLPAYFFFIFIGLEALITRLAARRRVRRAPANSARVAPGWAYLILLVPLVFSLAEWRLTPDHGPALRAPAGESSPAPEMAFIKLELLYRQAAEHIAPRLGPQSVLAAGDVGVLGFMTPARILDTVGLNSPISTGYYPLPAEQYVINYAVPTALILDQRPDWIVVLEVYGRRTFLSDPRFQAEYRLDEKIATDMYGSDGLLIFQRVP